MATRKTKKYFREEIKKGMSSAFAVLPEICKRYGEKRKISPRKSVYTIYTSKDVTGWKRDTSWRIKGFYLNAKKSLGIDIYWQGDSTDGYESIPFSGSTTSCVTLPPSEPVNLGDYWYTARDGITIRPEEIYEAIKGIEL